MLDDGGSSAMLFIVAGRVAGIKYVAVVFQLSDPSILALVRERDQRLDVLAYSFCFAAINAKVTFPKVRIVQYIYLLTEPVAPPTTATLICLVIE